MAKVSIIIVNWNTRDLLANCLNSIAATAGDLDLETIVVDNASSDGSPAMMLRQFPHVRLLANQENVGFARANNQAAAASLGRYLLLLNSDAQLWPNALQALLDVAEANPRVGIVGAQLRNADGSFQASHTPFPNLWQEFLILSGIGRRLFGRWYPSRGPDDDRGARPVDYVEGACLLVRREAFDVTGGLDENYFMYAEEVDWCYTLRQKGWQVWYQPAAKVMHLGGGSSQKRRTQQEKNLYCSRVQFFRKHYGDRAAGLLKLQIIILTAIKIVLHRLLRFLSRNHWGRTVVSLTDLVASLREV